jgi:hypothetical protein
MFVGIVAEMKLTINYNPEGQERILKLEDWIERLRIQLWVLAFEDEVKKVDKNLSATHQQGLKQAVSRVLFRYFHYVLLPRNVVEHTPAFFDSFFDPLSSTFMFTEALSKSWSQEHLRQCGWYLDCPKTKPPTFDLALRNNIQPTLAGTEMTTAAVDEVAPKRTRASRRRAVEEAAAKKIQDEAAATAKIREQAEATANARVAAAEAAAVRLRQQAEAALENANIRRFADVAMSGAAFPEDEPDTNNMSVEITSPRPSRAPLVTPPTRDVPDESSPISSATQMIMRRIVKRKRPGAGSTSSPPQVLVRRILISTMMEFLPEIHQVFHDVVTFGLEVQFLSLSPLNLFLLNSVHVEM